jgi:hypothetical protein
MKEQIGRGYYRLNVESDADEAQVDRMVREFSVQAFKLPEDKPKRAESTNSSPPRK